MKRMYCIALLFSVLFAGNTFSLTTYQMDSSTALLMRPLSYSAGDDFTLHYIGTNPGLLPNKVAGSSSTYNGINGLITYEVGFSGNLSDQVGDYSALVTIGLNQSQISDNLTGSYNGFVLPIANDNNQNWSFRSYVDDGTNPTWYSSWVSLLPGGTTTELVINSMPLTDFSTINSIGFEVQWTYPIGGSNSDTFHVSVIPVPSALLLGLIGLSSLRMRFRR